jgi:hypothetical protein
MSAGTPTLSAMMRGIKLDWRSITPADADLAGFGVYLSKTQALVAALDASALIATTGPQERI